VVQQQLFVYLSLRIQLVLTPFATCASAGVDDEAVRAFVLVVLREQL